MFNKTDPSILEVEQRYKDLVEEITKTCLAVEATCPHEIWCGRDTQAGQFFGPHDAIYICINCRMEVHIRWANYVNREKAPEGSIVLRPDQCGVKDVLSLRVSGDRRGFLTKEYSSFGGWPKREIKQKELVNDG